MTEAAIATQLQILTSAVLAMTQQHGTRLTRTELAERLRCHPNSITRWLRDDRHFPRPDKLGNWLLADVVKWEMERPASQQEKRETRCSK